MGGGERLMKGREIETMGERERERRGALTSEAQHENDVVFC